MAALLRPVQVLCTYVNAENMRNQVYLVELDKGTVRARGVMARTETRHESKKVRTTLLVVFNTFGSGERARSV